MPRKPTVLRPTPAQEFGLLVRELRMRQGWTQEELSRMSGVNKPSLGMFELGKRNLPPEQINNLLSLFGADILVRLPASFAFEEKAEPVGS